MVTGKVTSSGVRFDTIPNRYLPVTLQLHALLIPGRASVVP